MGYFDGGFTVSDVFQNQLSETWTTQQYFLPYFRNDVLLITGYPSTTTFISDASVNNNNNLTVLGDTRATKNSPYLDNYYSNYFDGSGDYLSVPSNTAFAFGTGDFTVECFFNLSIPQSTRSMHLTDSTATDGLFLKLNSGNICIGRTGTAEDSIFSYSFLINTWYHVAFSRSGTTVYCFVNGSLVGSTTNSISYVQGGYSIGTAGGAAQPFQGYISNLRMLKGTALYTAAFTPSTSPLTAIANTSLLTCQSNRFKDNSTNDFTITSAGDVRVDQFIPFTSPVNTYGSAYLDGTGDYLTFNPGDSAKFRTADFTVELWFYPTTAMDGHYLIEMRDAAATTGWVLAYGTNVSGQISWYSGTLGNTITESPVLTKKNQWNHVAYCRTSGVARLYINGVMSNISVSDTSDYNGLNTTAYIGSRFDQNATVNPSIFPGYITDIRFVKGTAVYTSTATTAGIKVFEPPAAPLLPMGTSGLYSNTANVNTTFSAANTSLLTLQTNRPHNNHTFFDNSSFNNLIIRNGNPNQGTFSPYGNRWSNYFDGASYYGYSLNTAISSSPLNFALNQDFTMEFWVYSRSTTADYYLLNFGTYNEAYPSERVVWITNKSASIWISGGSGTTATEYKAFYPASSTLSLNTWNHIAVVRSSNNLTVYVNGIGGTTVSAPGAAQPNSDRYDLAGYSHGFWFGINTSNWTAFSPTIFRGYMSNFRYVKGTALYTSNFIPPTAPLSLISNTEMLTVNANRFLNAANVNLSPTITQGSAYLENFSPFEPAGPFSDSTAFTSNSQVIGSTYFDSTGDGLTIPFSYALDILTGNFTIEGWIYPRSTASLQPIITQWNQNVGQGGFIWAVDGSTLTFYFGAYSEGTILVTSTSTIRLNSWQHVALVRNGSTFTVFINGVASGTGTSAATKASLTGVRIGIGNYFDSGGTFGASGANYYLGYMSDLRIVKSAVYTGNFTPPIAPLLSYGTTSTYTNTANINTTFAAANTSLLLNFANAAVKDYSGLSIIEHTGNVRLVSNVSKYGGTALYFDGLNGTQLKIPKLTANVIGSTVIGTANLTAEMWVYPLAMAAGTAYSLFTLGSEATNRYTALIENGQIKTNYFGAATANIGGNVQPNVWSHVAIVRNGPNINAYVNGIRLPNTETNSNAIGNGGANIGASGSGTSVFFGYIDDVRITTGNVRYTANFNVPNQLVIP